MGAMGGRAASQARRRVPVWIWLAAVVVVVAAVAAIIYFRSPPWDFTGFRVLAPSDKCWSGNVGVPGSIQNVSGCGSRDLRMTCSDFISLYITQQGTANWTLAAIVYLNGSETQRVSTTGHDATLVAFQPC